jgi:hypothetical protein
MAGTYGDMQTRISNEIGFRSDLTTQIQLAIQTAIAKYEREYFYFNGVYAQNAFNTVANQEFYTASDYAPLGTMAPRNWSYLEDISVNPAVTSTIPVDYAYEAKTLRLYPIPSGSYPITLTGTQRLATLSLTTDTNAWMTDAEALIRCEAKADLFDNYIYAPDKADKQRALSLGYLVDLRAETTRRGAIGKMRPTDF